MQIQIHSDVTLDAAPEDETIDIVTVFHDLVTEKEATVTHRCLRALQLDPMRPVGLNLIRVSNRRVNRGFAPACNLGASYGTAPVIGFFNPDVKVDAPFATRVIQTFDEDPNLVIAGNRFGKPARELKSWGLTEWVCGAAMFVRRSWWEITGGFDPKFEWAWEETDLIFRAQSEGRGVRDLRLPIRHASPLPGVDPPNVASYKEQRFEAGRQRYRSKNGVDTA